MKNEIIFYQPDKLSSHLEVIVQDETDWLNRHQLAILFGRDIKTIGKHVSNALKEELEGAPVVAKIATTANDGKTYQVEHYNLDMIISVGYRVKSKRGVQFRFWANRILKQYLLKGHAIDLRVQKIEDEIGFIKSKMNTIDFQIKTSLPPNEGIFFEGQVFDAYAFDAYAFVSEIIRGAKKSIHLVDNYIDESVLLLLSKRKKGVKVHIFTKRITPQLRLDVKKYNSQYPEIQVEEFIKSHDRFLILDEDTVYHIGASLKDLGKKWFAFSNIKISADLIINKLTG